MKLSFQQKKNCANQTIRTNVTTLLKFGYFSVIFFQQFFISGISGVIGQVTKVKCPINPPNILALGTQGEILIWQRKS